MTCCTSMLDYVKTIAGCYIAGDTDQVTFREDGIYFTYFSRQVKVAFTYCPYCGTPINPPRLTVPSRTKLEDVD